MAAYAGDRRYNDQLSDYSPQFFADDLRHVQQTVERIEAIDVSDLAEADKLNKALMVRSLREQIEAAQFKEWEMPATQFGGPHLSYAGMSSSTPFRSVQDYENYLARLRALPRVFAQITEDMRLGMRDHLMPPRYLLAKVAAQAQTVAEDLPEASPFSQPLQKFPNEFSSSDRERLKAAILACVKNEVSPAYAKFAAFVRTEYAPHGRTEMGVWALPDGNSRYRFAVRTMTTTDLSPEEIHQLGQKQVAEIEAEMLKIAQRQGFKDLKTFNEHIRKDRTLYAGSGQQLLDLYQHYADQMYAKLPQLFGRLPKNRLAVVPMEAYRSADSVPADYSLGSVENALPGRINVNEYDPEKRLLLNVEAIAYHEGVPGHHLQFSIANELSDLPAFRKFGVYYNAYNEGWAFYSERLGKEIGFYQDPLQRLREAGK
jgi:uncharacterized protein (DUF885 family)